MAEAMRPVGGLRLVDVTGLDLQAVEYLLDDLARHGLQVWPAANGMWRWAWAGQTGQAAGLGGAVVDALYWYFGLTPAPGTNP